MLLNFIKGVSVNYLHVIFEIKFSGKKFCVFKDLSERELNNRFIKPYKLKKDICYDGKIIPLSEISKLTIIATEENHKQELDVRLNESNQLIDDANISIGKNVIYQLFGCADYEIEHCGEDVTHKYINVAPGSGTLFTKLSSLIENPLSVAVAVVSVILTWIATKL